MNNMNNDSVSGDVNTANTNSQFSGLNGLGGMNNKSMSFESSTFETQDISPNCLVVDKSKFSTLDSYYTYLRQWFNNTGIVKVQDATDSVKRVLNYPYMFDIGFPNTNNETHAVIACSDIMAAKQFLINCKSGKFSTPALMFCFYSFNESDKRIAANNNIELVGLNEMYDLNNAITSVFGGLSIGNTLVSKLQRSLRDKFKDSKPRDKDIQSEFNAAGDNIMSIISDGFDQLKGSIASMLNLVGADKAANAVETFTNPFEPQAQQAEQSDETEQHEQDKNTFEAQPNGYTGPMEKVYGDSGNISEPEKSTVVIEKTNDVSIEKADEAITSNTVNATDAQPVTVNKPSVSLTKTDVQTTDNVVVQSDSTVSTAEDFLKLN